MNKQELIEENESLKEDVGYWSNMFHDEEHEVMKLREELEEVKQERDGFDSDLWTKTRTLQDLWEALIAAETLEDFKEIVDDEYSNYGRHSYTY